MKDKTLLYWGEDKPKVNGGFDITKPRAIQLPYSGKIKQIACGQFHVLILMEDGTVLSLGGNHEVHQLHEKE